MARVLVIDDDTTLRQLIAATLASAGHEVLPASSGEEGMALFQQHSADLVITDLIMPDDSLDRVLELRAGNPRLPFLLISGVGACSSRLEAAASTLQVSQTLPKPFTLAQLMAATEAALAGQTP